MSFDLADILDSGDPRLYDFPTHGDDESPGIARVNGGLRCRPHSDYVAGRFANGDSLHDRRRPDPFLC